MLKRIFVSAVCMCSLAVVAPAYASGPTALVKTYGGLGANAGLQAKPKSPSASPASTAQVAGTLPFTGRDLVVVVGAGLALVAAGGTLRGLGRRRS